MEYGHEHPPHKRDCTAENWGQPTAMIGVTSPSAKSRSLRRTILENGNAVGELIPARRPDALLKQC
jgi:hypothetical protein